MHYKMLTTPDLNQPVYMLMLSKLIIGISNDKEALEKEMREADKAYAEEYSLWRLVRI